MQSQQQVILAKHLTNTLTVKNITTSTALHQNNPSQKAIAKAVHLLYTHSFVKTQNKTECDLNNQSKRDKLKGKEKRKNQNFRTKIREIMPYIILINYEALSNPKSLLLMRIITNDCKRSQDTLIEKIPIINNS